MVRRKDPVPDSSKHRKTKARRPLTVAGLFAGIGGIEQGLHKAGHKTRLMCEIDPAAVAVLRARFNDVDIVEDVRELDRLPRGIGLLAAGFPCQDLSPVGTTKGIKGRRSGLVGHVFRLLDQRPVPWVLIENVPFMLQLGGGAAMRYITQNLEQRGYRWAYRVVDTRAFGLPQRRERVFMLASLKEDPGEQLFAEEVSPRISENHAGKACGFYWTEGTRGLGWAVDSVPTLKGGSGVGIPSPPAIWMRDGSIVTPSIRDAERLQGFPQDWTEPAEQVRRSGYRWTLVGNAVTVDVARWIGDLLRKPPAAVKRIPLPLSDSRRWPKAAFGSSEGRFEVKVGSWPVCTPAESIEKFLRHEPKALSHKAASGFLSRMVAGPLRYPAEFRKALEKHVRAVAAPDEHGAGFVSRRRQ